MGRVNVALQRLKIIAGHGIGVYLDGQKEPKTMSEETERVSPTQRTLRAMRHAGRTCGIVERFNRFAGPAGIRQDLFGFIDVVALDAAEGIIGVQCCARSGHAAHRRKICEERAQEAIEWLECGGKIELWSWGKQKVKRGGKAMRWVAKVEVITRQMIEVENS